MKQKRYWLRGGIVALIIDIVLVLSILLTTPAYNAGLSISLGLIQLPFTLIVSIFSQQLFLQSNSAIIIGGVICWFIFGAIVGLIYGKIKNRKSIVS